MTYILYNPKASQSTGETTANAVMQEYASECPEKKSVIGLDVPAFFATLAENDKVILVGGDGTLNHFVNDMKDAVVPCDIFLYGAGTGNDFLKDIADGAKVAKINDYIVDLPTVTINGKTQKYINGIGFGIDGKACEVADAMRAEGKTDINYASISIKLMFKGYDRPDAEVIVDGETKNYKGVWLASAMKGRYYGGGMNIAPTQDRKSGKLTLGVFHKAGRIRTLMIFPSIFKGTHIKNKSVFELTEGKKITVKFSHPMALQIDGETVLGVTEYTVEMPQ